MTTAVPLHNEKAEIQSKGYVYIIGAGPGDPELLTLKGERVLCEADVILYDDLVSSELVERFHGLKIYTGKRKDNHHFEQDDINEELLRHARQGKIVARLKGGDPFVFGRGGEEIEVLRKHGIGYEIVPGITAAYGASAYSEIPLTMRKISSSVAFCTGHPINKIKVPDADTLVYYMVASSVHDVLDAVVNKGWNDDTKVAIVQNATRYNQKIFTGTLGDLRKREKAVYSPALLIIGANINQFIEDNWYSKKKKVLITGDDEVRFNREKYIVVPLRTHRVDGADQKMVEQCFCGIEEYSVLFFPNRLSVTYFFKYLHEYGKDVRYLSKNKLYTLGNAAASELQNYGVIPDLCLEAVSPSEHIDIFRNKGVEHETMLLPCSTIIDEYLVKALIALKNKVTPLCLYSLANHEQDETIDLDFIDEIYFSSPTCVQNFKHCYQSIPETITVTTANNTTETAYRRVFRSAEG